MAASCKLAHHPSILKKVDIYIASYCLNIVYISIVRGYFQIIYLREYCPQKQNSLLEIKYIHISVFDKLKWDKIKAKYVNVMYYMYNVLKK